MRGAEVKEVLRLRVNGRLGRFPGMGSGNLRGYRILNKEVDDLI